MGDFEDKIDKILFKTNTSKQIVYGRGKKLRKTKAQIKIIKHKSNYFYIKKEKEKLKIEQ